MRLLLWILCILRIFEPSIKWCITGLGGRSHRWETMEMFLDFRLFPPSPPIHPHSADHVIWSDRAEDNDDDHHIDEDENYRQNLHSPMSERHLIDLPSKNWPSLIQIHSRRTDFCTVRFINYNYYKPDAHWALLMMIRMTRLQSWAYGWETYSCNLCNRTNQTWSWHHARCQE